MQHTTKVRFIDCRSLSCPLPLLKIAYELTQLSTEETLEALCDESVRDHDLAALCDKKAYTFKTRINADQPSEKYALFYHSVGSTGIS